MSAGNSCRLPLVVVFVVAVLASGADAATTETASRVPRGRIAVVAGGGLELINPASGRRRELATQVICTPGWSPNGRDLAWVSGDDFGLGSSVRAARMPTGRERTITHLGNALSTGLSWSHTGKHVALTVLRPYASPYVLVVSRVGRRRHVVAADASPWDVPKWSPTSLVIAYLGEQSGLYLASPDSGTRRLVTRDVSTESGNGFSWSPNGKRIAFVAEDASGRVGLFLADAIGEAARPRHLASLAQDDDGDGAGNVAWSPTADRIAFIRWVSDEKGDRAQAELCEASLHARPLNCIVRAPYIDEVAWSPDGSWLAYLTQDAGESGLPSMLHLVRVDGSGNHVVTSFSEPAGGLTWAPGS